MSEDNFAAEAAPIESASIDATEGASNEGYISSTEGLTESGEAIESNSEFSEESSESVQDAVEEVEALGGNASEEAKDLVRKFNFKVDGEEWEEEVDLSNNDDLQKRLQMGFMGQKRAQQYAELESEVRQEIEYMLENPRDFLEAYGHNPDDLAEKWLEDKIIDMQKSPEQLEQEQIQDELEELRYALAMEQEQKRTAQAQYYEEQSAIQIDHEISDALEKSGTLPKTDFVVARIADTLMWALDNDMEHVTAYDVIPVVERELKEDLQKLFSALPEDSLRELLGKPNLDKIRKTNIDKMKSTQANRVQETSAAMTQSGRNQQKVEKMSMSDFFNTDFAGN